MAKRFPVQIGKWKVNPTDYSLRGLLDEVTDSITTALDSIDKPGILLSGGVDSAVLAVLANRQATVPCFTIGSFLQHPDVNAATRLAAEYGWNLSVLLPCNISDRSGDNAVYMALGFASHFVSGVLAGDGIDEQVGGYWCHSHDSDRFTSTEETFEFFWNRLEPDHLEPMFKSATTIGIDVHWVYLDGRVVNYISRIPLSDRVHDGVSKAVWKDLARLVGIPDWVINRPKLGFVGALSV